MKYQKIAIFGLLGLLLATSMPVSASAHVNLDVSEKNYAPAVGSWIESGKVDVLSDGRVRITQDGTQTGQLYTDVSIPNNDDYITFISYTRAENPYPNFSNGVENISGLPYLYAYFLDKDGKIVEYISESSMRQSASRGQTWQVTYGTVDVPNTAKSLRLFLKQATYNGVTPDGRTAAFYKPGLYFVDSTSEASKIVEAYKNELSEMTSEFDNNNSNDNVNYSTGTILGCWGESKIYSVTSDDTLKLFPDEDTFYAWGHSFSEVKKISCNDLNDYKITGSWTYERASYLVKFHGQHGVYTLDNGKYLRLIPNEITARKMYGRNWNHLVRELPAREARDYSYSTPHRSLK